MASLQCILADGHIFEAGPQEIERSPLFHSMCSEANGNVQLPYGIEALREWTSFKDGTDVPIDRIATIFKVADFLQDSKTVNTAAALLAAHFIPAERGVPDAASMEVASATFYGMPDHLVSLIVQHREADLFQLLECLPKALHALVLRDASTQSLTHLAVAPTHAGDIVALSRNVACLPSLTNISVRLTDPALLPHLTQLEALGSLDMSNILSGLPPSIRPAQPWIAHLSALTQLRSLNCSGNALRREDGGTLVRSLMPLTRLEELNVDGTMTEVAAASALYNYLHTLPNLRRLRVCIPTYPKRLALALPALCNLTHLAVHRGDWTSHAGGQELVLTHLPASARLRHLEVLETSLTADSIAGLAASLASLTLLTHLTLRLSCCAELLHAADGVGTVQLQPLACSLATLTALSHLFVDASMPERYPNVPFTWLSSVVEALTSLRTLSVADLQRVSLPALTASLHATAGLCHLSLGRTDDPQALSGFAPRLARMSALSHLTLKCRVSDGIAELAPALTALPRLRHLDLSHVYVEAGRMEDRRIVGVAKALTALSALTLLNVGYLMTAKHFAAEMVATLTDLPSLQHLVLSSFSRVISSEVCASIAALTALTHLNLATSDMSSDTAPGALATALPELRSLQILNVGTCKFSNEGFRVLAPGLSSLSSHLRHLVLSGNEVGPGGLLALIRTLPSLSFLQSLDVSSYTVQNAGGVSSTVNAVAGLAHFTRIRIGSIHGVPDKLFVQCAGILSTAQGHPWATRACVLYRTM